MNENFNYVCSNCGSKCGYDGRCGDGPYLLCDCASPKNTTWINDGRGGYSVYLNDAKPVHITEFKRTHGSLSSAGGIYGKKTGWVCPKCDRAVAPDIKYCDCK